MIRKGKNGYSKWLKILSLKNTRGFLIYLRKILKGIFKINLLFLVL